MLRVTAPLLVRSGTGINDDLNGVELPVTFRAQDLGMQVEVVQSLAKWKRLHLADFGHEPGTGIYADMNAIRPHEVLGNLHSLYVGQRDWERLMRPDERQIDFLKDIVRRIYGVIQRTERYVSYRFSVITPMLPEQIAFVHSEDRPQRGPGSAVSPSGAARAGVGSVPGASRRGPDRHRRCTAPRGRFRLLDAFHDRASDRRPVR